MPGKNDYPASYEEVNRTLVGPCRAGNHRAEDLPADWLHYIGLDAPPKGDGSVITVSDDRGRVLADLITGKSEDIGDASGAAGLFVRRPKRNAELARALASCEPRSDPFDWLDKTIVDIDSTRIQSTVIDVADGQSFEVSAISPAIPISAGRKCRRPGNGKRRRGGRHCNSDHPGSPSKT